MMNIHKIQSNFKRRLAMILVMPIVLLLLVVYCLIIVKDELKHAYQQMYILSSWKHELETLVEDFMRVWRKPSSDE